MAVTEVAPVSCTMPVATASGERTYVATYRVITNDVNDGPITVRDATGIPLVNSTFVWGNDADSGARATSYEASWQMEDARKVWLVRVTYTSGCSRRNQDYQNDPVDKDPIISGGGIRFTKVAEKNYLDVPIATSAGEPFVDVRVDHSRQILRIQKNFDTINLDTFAEYTDSVNDDTFFGLSSRKWKMDPPEWEERKCDVDNKYYTVTFRFQANRDTWDVVVADRGSYFLDASNNHQRFKSAGIVVPKGNLNGISGLSQSGTSEPTDGTSSVEYLAFEYYEPKDFSALGIPTDFT